LELRPHRFSKPVRSEWSYEDYVQRIIFDVKTKENGPLPIHALY
jgi:hypothetical protein